MMNRRILFVDDEPQVLKALERTLGDRFEVSAVGSGAEAESLLASSQSFAVIVSDMRMPEMDGATLLARVRTKYPSMTRVLLTGYADFGATLEAVNEGNIFRFLVKPCPEELLERSLEDAIRQHDLIVAEKELLERTLAGAVGALAEVLSLVDPTLFSRALRVEALVKTALDNLNLEPRWAYEMAARLSQLGCVALPREIVQRANGGKGVPERERKVFERHPETGSRILRSIPRLEMVADMIRYQLVREVPKMERLEVQTGVEMLRIAVSLDALMQSGATREEAVLAVARRGMFEERIVRAFSADRLGPEAAKSSLENRVSIAELQVGMVVALDVLSTSGAVVIPAGREVTELVLERLRRFSEGVGLVEPIVVQSKGRTNEVLSSGRT